MIVLPVSRPCLTSQEGAGSIELTPKVDRLARPVDSEASEGWTRFEVPLRGGEGWDRVGDLPSLVDSIAVGFDSWGADALLIWVDGLSIH